MIVGILLAAGGARRFHSQKLIALLDDEAVVRHSARALAAAVDRVVVVVGSESDAVRAALDGMDVAIVENAEWELGLSGSLRLAISMLPAEVDAVVVTLGDQPGLDPGLIGAVVEVWHTLRRPIISANYQGVHGHPVLFARQLFGELSALEGDAGARLLIERNPARVQYIDVDTPMPLDVDTPADLDTLRQQGEQGD